ncbi:MAG: OmpA family protein [Burkholderiales bacterium]|nr:OmpA family protein [Burkholderiales bacterium]
MSTSGASVEMDRLMSYPVYGEGAPPALGVTLAACGLLMAVGATWIGQSEMRGPGPTPSVPQVVVPAAAASPSAAALAGSPITPRPVEALCPPPVALHFELAKARPDAGTMLPSLAGLAEWARLHPSARLAVEGHADLAGQDQSNLVLSYRRAKAVASLLQDIGVPPQQIHITAAGSHAPVDVRPGEAAANRRATVQVSDPDNCITATR